MVLIVVSISVLGLLTKYYIITNITAFSNHSSAFCEQYWKISGLKYHLKPAMKALIIFRALKSIKASSFSDFESELNVVVWIQSEDCKQTQCHKTSISPKKQNGRRTLWHGCGIDYDNSQSSNLDENELDKIIIEAKPANTTRSTSWGIVKFEKWILKRNIVVDLGIVTPQNLKDVLRKFYAKVITDQYGLLTSNSTVAIWAAIIHTLLFPTYSRNINSIYDCEYTTSNDMFSAKCKLFYKTNIKKPKH